MIDIHTHILPGLDDGPETLEESLEMAEACVSAGFTAVVATPHVIPGVFENSSQEILESVRALRKALEAEKIPLEVYPGAEYHITPDLPQDLAAGKLVTLGNTGKYLLVELPVQELPPYTEQVLFQILLNGVTPVLAHPERNEYLATHPQALAELVRKGVLVQVTAGCLTGLFGSLPKKAAQRYLKEGMVHFVATDAHGPGRRLEAAARAAALLGRIADDLLHTAPSAVIKGQKLTIATTGSECEERPAPKIWDRFLRRILPSR
ncbi:MAG: Tyrosine-protein phosphatase YwqE [Thermoanaerobacterales bacterium 50_218]|nr:MAG: Tyrosine-protein phosphatase YwqE [Thermoanaerobacterales bacterium 50_218]